MIDGEPTIYYLDSINAAMLLNYYMSKVTNLRFLCF